VEQVLVLVEQRRWSLRARQLSSDPCKPCNPWAAFGTAGAWLPKRGRQRLDGL